MVENKKPYTWEEIEKVLKKELEKTKHIMTFGTIGSRKVEKDIDTIITKKPESKSSDFYKEIHNLFDNLNSYLVRKYRGRVIRTSRFSDEEETKYIANYNKNDLIFQVLTYISFKQIKMHWFADLAPTENLENLLKKGYNCILGKPLDLFKSNFEIYGKEYLFIRLNDSDRINSHFPIDFLIKRMNVLFEFLFRKKLGLKTPVAKNKKQLKEVFYKLCDKLDELDKTKK